MKYTGYYANCLLVYGEDSAVGEFYGKKILCGYVHGGALSG